MEKNKKEESGDVFKADVMGKADKVFRRVLKETSKNHVSVGGSVGGREGVGSEGYDYSFYNPHNARFYFLFDKSEGFNPGGLVGVGFRIINGRELCLDDWRGFRFVVKKRMIEVTNKRDSKRVFKIEGNAGERHEQVVGAVALLEREAVLGLRDFVSVFGGGSDFVVRKSWIPDNKILHEELVDSVGEKVTFRNDVVKKVYRDKPLNVEFSDPVFASNYFRNVGLRYYAPEIVSGLDGVRDEFVRFEREALLPLTEQIKLHLAVQSETLAVLGEMKAFFKPKKSLKVLMGLIRCLDDLWVYRDDVAVLGLSEREKLSVWLFERFGGV